MTTLVANTIQLAFACGPSCAPAPPSFACGGALQRQSEERKITALLVRLRAALHVAAICATLPHRLTHSPARLFGAAACAQGCKRTALEYFYAAPIGLGALRNGRLHACTPRVGVEVAVAEPGLTEIGP